MHMVISVSTSGICIHHYLYYIYSIFCPHLWYPETWPVEQETSTPIGLNKILIPEFSVDYPDRYAANKSRKTQ